MDDSDLDEQYQMEEGSELAFDPDQDADEKREIRRNYRKLQDDEELMNPNNVGIDILTQKVQTANKLFQKVKGPSEATLDSAFLVTASTLGAAKARQMRAEIGGFDIDEFIENLVSFMGGHQQSKKQPTKNGDDEVEIDETSSLEWESIGRKVMVHSRRVPVMDFMLGPLYIEPKKRNVVRRHKMDIEKEIEKRPEELTQKDIKASENETSKSIVRVTHILEQQGHKVNLFKLIINPESFGQSVENLFYLSFMIWDGKAALEYDPETAEPLIYSCEPPGPADYDAGLRKQQMVMELDVATWKRAIDVFHITSSMIPTRPEGQH